MKKLVVIAEKAMTTSYRQYRTVIEGFSISVYWDANHKWFECCMLFSPSWAGKEYIYGKSIEELVENAKVTIADAKKVYKNGGHFSDDYYENPPYLRR